MEKNYKYEISVELLNFIKQITLIVYWLKQIKQNYLAANKMSFIKLCTKYILNN